MKNKNLYYATDKNIFDALHHKRVTATILHDMLFAKGIIVSDELDKEVLIDEVCRLPLCYSDLMKIKELVQTYDKRESSTYAKLDTTFSQEQLIKAAESVKKHYASKSEKLVIRTKKDGSIGLELDYEDLDLSRTELRQIDKRSLNLELKISDDGVDIRMPQIQKSKDLVNLLQKELTTIANKPVDRFELSLEAIVEPKLRSQFFRELINGLDDYEVDDVTNVELNRIKTSEDENSDDDTEIDTSFVKKVLLKGAAVDSSPIFAQLHSKGYYISRIAWASKPKVIQGDRIQVEAFFKNADLCNDFSYQIKGINNYRNDKYNITTRAASDLEKKTISLMIESAAMNAYNAIKIK